MNRIDRISALLVQLQSRPIVKASEMAERFGVSMRTVYRDMRTLSEAGVPVCGDSGIGYSLVEGYRLPSLMFTKEEAVAFLTAEKMVGQLTNTRNSYYYRLGMDKIRAALRSMDKNYLHQMDQAISVYKSRHIRESVPNLLQDILHSVRERRIVEIGYTNAEGEQNARAVEAVGVTYSHPYWYLSAWCRLRSEYRMFRFDRISEITITEHSHSKAHPPLETLVGDDEPRVQIKVVLRTSAQTARYHADKCHFLGLTDQKELSTGQVEQTYMPYSLEPIARWALANTDTTSVISPEEVKNIIRQIVEKSEL